VESPCAARAMQGGYWPDETPEALEAIYAAWPETDGGFPPPDLDPWWSGYRYDEAGFWFCKLCWRRANWSHVRCNQHRQRVRSEQLKQQAALVRAGRLQQGSWASSSWAAANNAAAALGNSASAAAAPPTPPQPPPHLELVAMGHVCGAQAALPPPPPLGLVAMGHLGVTQPAPPPMPPQPWGTQPEAPPPPTLGDSASAAAAAASAAATAGIARIENTIAEMARQLDSASAAATDTSTAATACVAQIDRMEKMIADIVRRLDSIQIALGPTLGEGRGEGRGARSDSTDSTQWWKSDQPKE